MEKQIHIQNHNNQVEEISKDHHINQMHHNHLKKEQMFNQPKSKKNNQNF